MSILACIQALEVVERLSGRNDKLAMLRQAKEVSPLDLFKVAQYTMNPMWTYRVTAPVVHAPDPEYVLEPELAEALWGELLRILGQLRNKEYSSIADVKTRLSDLFALLDTQCLKWFARVVNRDLKIGFQDWNKIYKDMLPEEPVMLCETWDGNQLDGQWVQEPKLDGLRAAIVVGRNGHCDAISRGGKEFWNWDHIAAQIASLGLRGVVLDGEFFAGHFGLSASITKSQKTHAEADKLKYWFFDMLTLEEWESRTCKAPLLERKDRIKHTFRYFENQRAGVYGTPVVGSPNLIVVESKSVSSSEDVDAGTQELYDNGYEGSLLKRVEAPYIWDRTTDWLKIKPEGDGDVRIVDAELGKPGTKNENRLGAIIVEGTVSYKKKQYDIKSKVGGGFTDSDRDRLWAEHRAGRLVGKVAEIGFQDVTSEISSSSTPSLRFPKFRRLRDDK